MFKKPLITIILVFMLVFSMGLAACSSQDDETATSTTGAEETTVPSMTTVATATLTAAVTANQIDTLPDIAEVVAKVRPSVVAINVMVTTSDFFDNPVQQEGAGSGWVIRSDGYIVTNAHVVEGADDIVVTTSDGSIYAADEVFTDTYTDLAIIKIDAENLPALETADSTAITVGEWVIAIGNALGVGISATAGIVSARDVSLTQELGEPLDNLIQTDTAINPGNSGGPLVNLDGEVIGITSLKITLVGVEGMGYAISIDQALPVINSLIENGAVIRPWLGITAYTVDEMVAAYYNLPVDSGILITDVVNGSPADQAGLRPGDVITAVNDTPQTDSGNLTNFINSLQVGDEITVTYYRDTNQQTATVTLGQNPS